MKLNISDYRVQNLLQTGDGDLLQVVDLNLKTGKMQLLVVNRSKFPLEDGWQAEPIPLNRDSLMRMGAIVYGKSFRFFGNILIEGTSTKGYHFRWGLNGKIDLKYVHVAQNLLHALSGGREIAWKIDG